MNNAHLCPACEETGRDAMADDFGEESSWRFCENEDCRVVEFHC